jgi:mannose-6-phosphate isomerase-like protein (cupin superfamily)
MRLEGAVKKGWGGEYIFATNDKYCGKTMYFHKDAKFSMHFHSEKDETWLILEGQFEVRYIDTKDASMHSEILNEGDTWRNFPLEPHQLICLRQGVIVEVSTPDSVEDNYRVGKGDSQNASNG